jgi:hypothetical protein
MKISETLIRKIIRESIVKEVGFDAYKGTTISGQSVNKKQDTVGNENYNISQLKFEQIDISSAGDNARNLHSKIGGAGVREGDPESNKKIVELIHKPIYDAIKGDGAMERDKKGEKTVFQYYVDNLNSNAWSAWFLNRCYLGTPAEPYIKSIAKTFTDSGCCYPYAYIASNNRSKVFNEPDALKGKTMLMIFSKEEIDSSSDLSLSPGVASIVGQSGGDPNWENIRTSTQLVSGEKHMNIMAGPGQWIGGNLSNSTGVKNDSNKGGYMILVKFVGLKEEDSVA